jgi:very-short-patch-repair endonuclease
MARRINARLGGHARAMRTNATEPEHRLWAKLRASQLGVKFRRQAVIEPYIVDFLCPWNGLIIELDGDTHDLAKDMMRDAALETLGYTVFRFSNGEIMANISGVMESIAAKLAQLLGRRKITHPHPTQGRAGR